MIDKSTNIAAEDTDYIRKARAEIDKAMVNLSDRKKLIINLRYLSEDKTSLQKIGDKLRLSKERVRQLESEALAEIRKNLLNSSSSTDILEGINCLM